jgi:hypothetical protein
MRKSSKKFASREFLMFSRTAIAALATSRGRRTTHFTLRTQRPLLVIIPQVVPTLLPPILPPLPSDATDVILRNGRSYTLDAGAAYASYEENNKGPLEPDKMADFVVWKVDPLAGRVKDMQLAMTIIAMERWYI